MQPIELAPGVRTVGELELIDHVERGLALVDTRLEHFHRAATIPGASNIPHKDVLARIDELDSDNATVFFCNGPQCAATPDAVRTLLAAGHPAGAILYYRGGMHDWMTLGYPTVPGPREARRVPGSCGSSATQSFARLEGPRTGSPQ
ncbi:MAG TPA: rhodanese-like domain-containing protein [Thermoleophilaceae bacterium]|nr:rhodanese-like domain-containing protein [Thermoleophilaceae bacterium]